MGANYSDCASVFSSSSTGGKNIEQACQGASADKRENRTLTSKLGLNELEVKHLLLVRRSIIRDEHQNQQHREKQYEEGQQQLGKRRNTNFMTVLYLCAHKAALSPFEPDIFQSNVIEKRCRYLEMVLDSCDLITKLENFLSFSLFGSSWAEAGPAAAGASGATSKATLGDQNERYLELVSSMLWRHGTVRDQKTSLEFLFDSIYCSQNDKKQTSNEPSATAGDENVLASDLIQLFLEIGIVLHHLLSESTFQGGEIPRDNVAENKFIEAMTSSLLEYANEFPANASFGWQGSSIDGHNSVYNSGHRAEYGGPPSSAGTRTKSGSSLKSVTKQQFKEWHSKVVPDMILCSLVQLLRVLFFPPCLPLADEKKIGIISNSASARNITTILRQYENPYPQIVSSKHLFSRHNDDITIVSPVFGKSSSFSPPIFSFVSISQSKFGGKWYRIYAGAEDGWTFNQLEHALIGYHGPTLFMIEAKYNNDEVIIGAYTASKWEKHKKDFFGSHDCFLFQIYPSFRILRSLPKIGNKGGHYMYFHHSLSKTNDDMAQGLGFGGTVRHPRFFVDCHLEECCVAMKDTSFEEGSLGPLHTDDMSSFSLPPSSRISMHISSLEVYAIGSTTQVRDGFQAQVQHRDIADAALRNARTVDKAAFLGDLRNGAVESKAFSFRQQVDGRGRDCLKGEDKANGL